MKNEVVDNIYYMGLSLMGAWKNGDCAKSIGITIVQNNGKHKNYVYSLKDGLNYIVDFFGNKKIQFADSLIYVSQVPSVDFVKMAKLKRVYKIYFIKNGGSNTHLAGEEAILEPFVYSFGRIIDMFSYFSTITNTKA